MAPGDIIHDTTLKGFGARRQKDAASYFLKTRVNGKQRWFTIGRHGQPWTPDSARKHALQILANPQLAEKVVPKTERGFEQAAAEFLQSHGPKLKASTLSDYERLIRTHLNPTFGPKPLADITRADVSTWHAKHKDNPRTANYALSVLSKIMTWSEDQGYRPDHSNPVRRIGRYKENKREYFMQGPELARLGTALDTVEAQNLVSPYALAAIRLLIMTGARVNEILSLQWAHVDLDRRMLFLTDSKTGQKPISLSEAAIEILKALPRFANNPYVIIGRHGAHLVNLAKPWNVIRKLANLPKVRMHDLRHTYASVAVATGGSLPILGRQLGHSQPQTTQRYAHLADDPVRKMNETTGETLVQALKGNRPE
jgi:integrase